MPRPARKRQAVATDENSHVTQKSIENIDNQSSEHVIRTPLSTITNAENHSTTRRSSSRARKLVVYTERSEDHVSDEASDDKSTSSSSTDQIDKDLMLLPEPRKRAREEEEEEGENEDSESEESEDSESDHVRAPRTRESDKERAEKLKLFEEEQAARFAEIDDFELHFEEVAEDSFDRSMSEGSGESQDQEVELDDVLGGREED
ncbi:hypothetical protein CJU90_4302 [Yarrowia sp. C11]|nr:hypothetical protein CJU90_4302 [Yarrowia sp. C11]